MRIRAARAVLAPNQGYVCLSCRLQNPGTERGRSRRYVHSNPPDDNGDKAAATALPKEEKKENVITAWSAARFRLMFRDFMSKDAARDGKRNGSENGNKPDSLAGSNHEPSTRLESVVDNTEAMREKLQSKFLALRHKQMLEHQAGQIPKPAEIKEPTLESPQVSNSAQPPAPKPTNRASRRAKAKSIKVAPEVPKPAINKEPILESPQVSNLAQPPAQKPTNRASRRAKAKSRKVAPEVKARNARSAQKATVDEKGPRDRDLDHLEPLPDSKLPKTRINSELETVDEEAQSNVVKVPSSRRVRITRQVIRNKTASGQETDTNPQVRESGTKTPRSEKERKAELAKKLVPIIKEYVFVKGPSPTSEKTVKNTAEGLVRLHLADRPVRRHVSSRKIDFEQKDGGSSKVQNSSTNLSDVAGFNSVKSVSGGKAGKVQTTIEKVDATELEILPVKVEQPPVPGLAYGLERVLFNPGVYQLQDPRSRVYNFDPYLQDIMPVSEFDFNALKEYITSSRDESLKNIAMEHAKRYVGSTSSMTGALAHFHFLLSQWRPINTSMLSKSFPTNLSSFTELQRTPSAIFLRWKDGVYAIDADKQFDTGNILSMLGKSMEKLLTLKTEDYERYRKSSSGGVTEDEQLAPESYHYSTMGDFLMRSQLDAHDARLPGTGMFDLKTRAVVSIRMDVTKYEHGIGYQIKSRQGEWESYEREYYDLIRAAFLKYSMQVRMGRMDGIFVAFHNIERIFGFQYISLPEMDSTIHGQWDTSIGDQEFKLSLDLLNKILDKATKKFPETSLRIHFETRETATPFMYIFAEPVTEEQVAEIQGQNQAKIQEFERKILGLNHEEESQDQVNQDDDGKWDNIQASVQEAMDKDELSVDGPFEDQQSEDEDVEEHEALPDGQQVIEEGPLYANRIRIVGEEDTSAETAGADVNEDEEDKDGESAEMAKEGDEEQVDEEADEESEENGKVESEEENQLENVNQLEDRAEAVEEDNAITEDAADNDKTLEGSTAPSNEDPTEMRIEASAPAGSEHEGQEESEAYASELTKEVAKPPAAAQSAQRAEKAAYIPPVPGEEPTDSKHPTEADSPFLDEMDQETAQSHDTPLSEVLAMTLTLRNKVNHQFVLRPERLNPGDVWSIEYSLAEVPTPKRARALYEACQTRRRKKLDAPEVPEDAEVLTQYLANLRELSTKGKKWRKKMDERDRERPIQVLGRNIAKKDVGGRSSDQESQA